MNSRDSLLESATPPKVSVQTPESFSRNRDDFRQLYRAVLDTSPDAIFLIDRTGRSFIDVNPVACQSLGYTREELLASGPRLLHGDSTTERFDAQMEAALEGSDPPRQLAVHQHRCGQRFLVERTLREVATDFGPVLILIARPARSTIAPPADREQPAAGVSIALDDCDPLTGLPGRKAFEHCLEAALEEARHEPAHSFAVFFVDLDGFKAVNDTLGHLVGDRLLCEIAQRLAGCIRPDDIVARRGGDEFTLLIDNLRGPDDAIRVAQRIRTEVVAHAQHDGTRLAVTASIGIALNRPGYRRPEELIHDADMAMYQAKAMGKAHFVLHSVKAK